MNTLHQLLALVPTPNTPVRSVVEHDWADVETQLDLQLPVDYKAVCEAYGRGQFARYISILDLRSDDLRIAIGRAKITRDHQMQWPQFTTSIPIYPEKSGMFLLGLTEVNGGIYWRTTEHGESIILTDSKDSEFFIEYQMSLSSFLLKWFLGEVKPSHFPDNTERDDGEEDLYEDEEERVDPLTDRQFYSST
jgi:hypothetical protein